MNLFTKKVTPTNRIEGYFNVPAKHKEYFSTYNDNGKIDIFLEDNTHPIIGRIDFKAQTITKSPRISGNNALKQWFSDTPENASFSVEVLPSFIRITLYK